MNLTEIQEDAIRHSDSNLHLLSCAGSGKTEVVAPRVAIILTTGLRPSNVVVFTFTDKAAAEFKERIISRCQEAIDEIYGKAEMHIGSIHAFCLDLLTAEVPKHQNLMYSTKFCKHFSLTAKAKRVISQPRRTLPGNL